MNTSVCSSEQPSWSRRCSIESILSIQGHETDVVRDTSDTEPFSDEEFEPFTDVEEDKPPVSADSSGDSDDEIITTRVVEVLVGDDGDLQFADSEQTDSNELDSEIDPSDYWRCAQCNVPNNNPLYRYCEKCYKVRQSFFPPRPKRKQKRPPLVPEKTIPDVPRTMSQDSGIESQLSQTDQPGCSSQTFASVSTSQLTVESRPVANVRNKFHTKRRAESVDRKRARADYSDLDSSDLESDRKRAKVAPLAKTTSDPSLTVESMEDQLKKRVISNVLKETVERDQVKESEADSKGKSEGDDGLCIICLAEPKSGVFVHGRIAHICCCYKCAVKVWSKVKRCPVCNCRVSNVLKAVVM